MPVTIVVDGKEYQVNENKTILEACRDIGYDIPTLCYHPALTVVGSCRVCVVEVEGARNLAPACATKVADGMVIKVNSDRVKKAVRFNLGLLLSNHPNDCMTCDVNGRCEFQDLIYRYDVKDMFPKELRNSPYDESSPSLFRDMNKCIACGRCVRACEELQGLSILSMVNRGHHTLPLPALGAPIAATDCINCGQCATVCPVGAITERPDFRKVLEEIDKHDKVLVVQTAPAVRVALGEEFGEEPGTITTGKMVAALRRIGFDYVFDTNFAADLTIMEEGSELLDRIKNGGNFPMFTSCCPGWVNLMEKLYPEYTENLSSAKSPHEMLGALAKTYFAERIGKKPEDIFVVSIMPCTAKKDEATREQLKVKGVDGVDIVLTTRELGKLIKMKKIPYESLPEEEYDKPLGISTGAAAIFGTTGGVMEAALRTAYEIYTGKELPKVEFEDVRGFTGVKEAVVSLGDKELKIAVAHGGSSVINLLEKLRSGEAYYDFIEIMACPGGCIGGGGQPKSNKPGYLERRMEAIYTIDEMSTIRKSHENPAVLKLYEEYLGQPLSHLSHELLHTHYRSRKESILERKKELEEVE
ncbi:MAG: ferredoxin [Thermotogae bacterium]|uniref:NADH-dependent [FeFe] hydrogenase, group A6 n=1 Tax=Kosmotoga sp. TaxID=1955248 RepID=UPI000F1EECD4|nr:NADH-dependent [FeFe] hydrogenase, group A6 [Kosmotoga sp.]MBO8165621.1 iron hydrogenase small subunit [Kosmotoga sp.]RKX49018.1 MAG: ferredoxin [Thermotogota bacterium]